LKDNMLKVRFHHPLNGAILNLDLPAATTFSEILKILYKNGFLQKKTADYSLIIGKHLCAMNKSICSYVTLDSDEAVDIEVNGMLTIMC